MSVHKLLNPRNDLAFKRIFGTERNKDLLLHFLNDVLGPQRGKVIADVSLIQTDQLPEIEVLRESAVDVLCTDDQGNRFIVEMQVEREEGFEKRVQYYAAKAYIEQRGQGGVYKDLKEVIFIAILDHILFEKKESYNSQHRMMDIKTHEHDLKDLSFSFIELDKFHKNVHQLTCMLDKWIYFLKHGEELTPDEFQALTRSAPVIHRAVDEVNRVNWTAEQLRAYDSVEKRIFSHKGELLAAQHEGEKIGLKKGLHKGLQEGLEKGAFQKAQEIAGAMLAIQMDLKIIAQTTGLSEEEIRSYHHKGG